MKSPGWSAFCWGVLFAAASIFLHMPAIVVIPAFVVGAFFGLLLYIASPPKPERRKPDVPMSEYVRDVLPPLLPNRPVREDDGFDDIVDGVTR